MTEKRKERPRRLNYYEKGRPTPPSIPPKLKQQFMRAQIRLMELRSKPLNLKEFDIKSLKGITSLINELIRLNARRELESHDMRAIVDALEVLRKIYQPSELEEAVDELLKETTELRVSFAELRKRGLSQSGAGSGTEPDPSGSSLAGAALERH
jgi:hypothetical protein